MSDKHYKDYKEAGDYSYQLQTLIYTIYMIYINLSPSDFVELQNNRGELYQILSKRKSVESYKVHNDDKYNNDIIEFIEYGIGTNRMNLNYLKHMLYDERLHLTKNDNDFIREKMCFQKYIQDEKKILLKKY